MSTAKYQNDPLFLQCQKKNVCYWWKKFGNCKYGKQCYFRYSHTNQMNKNDDNDQFNNDNKNNENDNNTLNQQISSNDYFKTCKLSNIVKQVESFYNSEGYEIARFLLETALQEKKYYNNTKDRVYQPASNDDKLLLTKVFEILSICESKLKKYTQSQQSLNNLLKTTTHTNQIYANLAFTHFKLNNYGKSLSFYQKINNNNNNDIMSTTIYQNYVQRLIQSVEKKINEGSNCGTLHPIPRQVFEEDVDNKVPQLIGGPGLSMLNDTQCHFCTYKLMLKPAIKFNCCNTVYHEKCFQHWNKITNYQEKCPKCASIGQNSKFTS